MTPTRATAVGKLVVVGVGLIGGSLALALKSAGAVNEVVGVGRTRGNLDDALARGIVGRYRTLNETWTEELGDADVVVFATPVAQLPALFAAAAPCLGAATISTDAGSTKQDVIAAARAHLGAALARFVPAHPIAGTEHTGAAAAFATLFQDRNVVLTPLPETDPAATQRVEALWSCTGATVHRLDPALHDRIFAAVSHLPHVLAFALVDELAARPDAAELLRLRGERLSRLHADRCRLARDVARYRARQSRGAVERDRHLSRAPRRHRRADREWRRRRAARGIRTGERGTAGVGSRPHGRCARRRPARSMTAAPVDGLVLPAGRDARGSIVLPGSKSISNRTLLLAALATGTTVLEGLLDADDVSRMRDALRTLGVDVRDDAAQRATTVQGAGGKFPVQRAELFLGNAGTAFRPLTAVLALMGGEYVLRGVPRMHERPIGDLVDALRIAGADVRYVGEEGYPPLVDRRGGPASRGGGSADPRQRVEPVPVGAADGAAAR